jgi:hypothetical protein
MPAFDRRSIQKSITFMNLSKPLINSPNFHLRQNDQALSIQNIEKGYIPFIEGLSE